jgi:hypothetical protein
VSQDLSHDLSIYTPVLKGLCKPTKQESPPSKRQHEDQGALQTGQGQSYGNRGWVIKKYQKLWTSHRAPLNPLFKNWKNMASQQTCQERALSGRLYQTGDWPCKASHCKPGGAVVRMIQSSMLVGTDPWPTQRHYLMPVKYRDGKIQLRNVLNFSLTFFLWYKQFMLPSYILLSCECGPHSPNIFCNYGWSVALSGCVHMNDLHAFVQWQFAGLWRIAMNIKSSAFPQTILNMKNLAFQIFLHKNV